MKTFIKSIVLCSLPLLLKVSFGCGQAPVDCPRFNKEIALKDIKSSHPKLLFMSGIVARYNAHDPEFSKKYGISFFDFGCTPDKSTCMLAYNQTVFEFLDKKFGEKWRSEVRQDVIGLKNKLTE